MSWNTVLRKWEGVRQNGEDWESVCELCGARASSTSALEGPSVIQLELLSVACIQNILTDAGSTPWEVVRRSSCLHGLKCFRLSAGHQAVGQFLLEFAEDLKIQPSSLAHTSASLFSPNHSTYHLQLIISLCLCRRSKTTLHKDSLASDLALMKDEYNLVVKPVGSVRTTGVQIIALHLPWRASLGVLHYPSKPWSPHLQTRHGNANS